MTFRKIILFLLISLSLVANAQARMPTERPASTPASIFELPPFERAVCCIRFYEGMHRAKDYPYVGYGHKLRPGERYSANMSTYEAEQLLRKDLRALCAMFRSYGQDSHEGNHIPKRDSAFVLTDARGDVVQKVCMDKLILHRMELCVLKAESLKSYSATDCGREPFADSYLQERSDTVEHVTATNGRPKKS